VQDDGNLVLYAGPLPPFFGRAMWETNTNLIGLMHTHNQWHHQDGFNMAGDGYLTLQGQIRADIVTWNMNWIKGFTGGCLVVLFDANENIIHKWLLYPMGVNARMFHLQPSNRSDHFDEQIDPALAAQAVRIELWFQYIPKNRWDDILAKAKTLGDLVSIFIKLPK
jgi:hypothetical protein